MNLGHALLAASSLILAAQSTYAALLMLYIWEDEEKHKQGAAPTTFDPPQHSFTLLLPARHEETVIQQTVQRIVDLNYPRDLLQVLVVIEAGDTGTIAKVEETLDALDRRGIQHIRLVTFDDPPINKPHGLNVGLAQATGDVVTIFDAEDEPHPDILHVVNTIMVREGAVLVQSGVQLMNYSDHWYASLNVLEYFFWFKSRMHHHATMGMMPLGGNTVFIQRDLLVQTGGWDQNCLTEDADIGIRLSAAGIPTRVVYDDRYVTREETPPSVSQFVKQRTRWDQGFLQVLIKGEWRSLPTVQQRLLALYTLAFPLLQALMLLYLPVSLWSMFAVKVPVLIAMLSTLPLYMLLVQFLVNLMGLYEFARIHDLRLGKLAPLHMLVAYLPYQWLLSYAALRAVWRQFNGVNTWEKTRHVGAHRVRPPAMPILRTSHLLEEEDIAHG